MARRTISPGVCIAIDYLHLHLVVSYGPRQKTKTTSSKVHRSPRGLSSLGCEQVVDPMFWRGPYYTTRWTGVRFRAVQTPGDIVRLAIVLSVVPSFKSVHIQQDVTSTQSAWYVPHSQDFLSRAQYMYEKHFHDAKSWPLCCISPAPAPSAIALLHRKWLKRTHKVLNSWNSINMKWWSHIFKFLYIAQLSYKRKLHNPKASAINLGCHFRKFKARTSLTTFQWALSFELWKSIRQCRDVGGWGRDPRKQKDFCTTVKKRQKQKI